MTAIAVRAPLRVGVSRSRRVKDRAFSVFIWVAAVLALLPLGFIAGYVIAKGVKALNVDFFTKAPVPPPLTGGGFGPAFVGSAMMVGLAALFAIPLGVLAAVYLSEYGRGRLASGVRDATVTAELMGRGDAGK